MPVYIWIIFNLSKVSLNFCKICTKQFACKLFFFFFFLSFWERWHFSFPSSLWLCLAVKLQLTTVRTKEKNMSFLWCEENSGLILTGLMMKYQCPHMISMNVAFVISEKLKLHAIFSLGQYYFQDIKTCWKYQSHKESTCKSA